MGDCSDGSDCNDESDVMQKIRQLEKEKNRLEKQQSKKRQLEQRYKELSKSVNSLKGSSSSSSGYGSSSTNTSPNPGIQLDKNRSSGDMMNVVSENNRRLNQVLQNRYSNDPGTSRTADGGDDNPDHSSSESDEEEKEKNLDRVMSSEHKQKLQDNRGTLVDSMIPDDIFNDLIASKVISTADVGRIKEKNTREAINEELLNNLIRRSDRAFYEFVRSLRRTLQGYLADLLDDLPQQKPPKKRSQKRKRKMGEINVNLGCEDIIPQSKRKPPMCSCQEVEEQVLTMAKTAYHAIRRRDNTPASFEQFKKELSQTNGIVKETMEIMHTLKILCKHGDEITDISYGSVKFTIRCNTTGSLQQLWEFYTSGSMLDLLHKGLVTQSLLSACRAKDIKLRVKIAEEEYMQCLRELECEDRLSNRSISPTKITRTTVPDRVLRSYSKPSAYPENTSWRGKYFKDQTEPWPRRAFKEIQRNLAILKGKPYEEHNICPTTYSNRPVSGNTCYQGFVPSKFYNDTGQHQLHSNQLSSVHKNFPLATRLRSATALNRNR